MASVIEWIQPEDADQSRLDACLAGERDWLTRSVAQHAIKNGKTLVNGVIIRRPSLRLNPGDSISAELSNPADGVSGSNPDIEVNIIYRDEHIFVVDKPAGISVHPGSGHTDDTLVNGLLHLFPEMASVGPSERPGVAHRLDKDTSGLLVFALTDEALNSLGEMMREHAVKRVYKALAHGKIEPDSGVIDAPIGRDPGNRTRQAVIETGKPARTHYRLVETIGNRSFLEVRLETGRMHQIRVHLNAIGFPVLGDPVYGASTPRIPGLTRQFLHAAKLEFDHPITGERLKFESPLPAELQEVLDRLKSDL